MEGFRLITQEACPQCGTLMEDEHQHLKCPSCLFIVPCCEGGDTNKGLYSARSIRGNSSVPMSPIGGMPNGNHQG